MNIEINCGNCYFFKGNKDKHGSEGACKFMPPVVFPNPVRKPITNEVVMMQAQFNPVVKEDDYCGQFAPNQEVRTEEKQACMCMDCGKTIMTSEQISHAKSCPSTSTPHFGPPKEN